MKIKWYLQTDVSAKVHIENKKKKKEIMTWTTEIRYFIFWQVINHFQIPFIVSPIVCIYELKYRMWWSNTIYNI